MATLRHTALLTIAALLLTACRTTRVVEHTRAEVRDSIIERVRIDTLIDTLRVDIPLQAEQTVVLDSSSHLENDYAISDAAILPDGRLQHSLRTKPQAIETPVTIYVPSTDKETYHDGSSDNAKTIYVETNKLRPWQTFIVGAGATSLVFMLSLIFVALRRRRKGVHGFS